MYPVIFTIGPITLYTYGLFVALGFMAAMWYSKHLARKNNISGDLISDIYIIILVSAIIGARALYIIIEFDSFSSDWLSVFKIWQGGLVFYGGFITGIISTVWYLHYKKTPLWLMSDMIAPGIALGHAIGRFGCLFAGCCYGHPCELPWAIQFTHPESLAPVNMLLHPTQIYEILSNSIIFLILTGIEKKKSFNGMVFSVYIILYSMLRFIIEFFRGDFRGDLFNNYISTSQGIAIVFAIFGITLFFILSRRKIKH